MILELDLWGVLRVASQIQLIPESLTTGSDILLPDASKPDTGPGSGVTYLIIVSPF